MPKAVTLVDDFGFYLEDGSRSSHEKGAVVDLDQERFDALVAAGSVEPADKPKGRGKPDAGSVEPADDAPSE